MARLSSRKYVMLQLQPFGLIRLQDKARNGSGFKRIGCEVAVSTMSVAVGLEPFFIPETLYLMYVNIVTISEDLEVCLLTFFMRSNISFPVQPSTPQSS